MTVLTVDENSFSNTNLSIMNGRQCSTLPRRFSGSNKMPVPPAVPRRDPKTTLSVGRARARSMVAGLEANEDHDECEDEHGNQDDHHGVNHGPDDLLLEALGLFLEFGQTL